MIVVDQTIKTNIVSDIFVDNQVQRLTILANEELRVVITIPHNVFEWFVDVFDTRGNKVHSSWIDHYGDTDSELKSEMKESVERFIDSITQNPLRVIPGDKPEQSTLEIYADEMWTASLY